MATSLVTTDVQWRTEFLGAVVRERKESTCNGGMFLRDLEGAVEILWVKPLKGRDLEAAMDEVDRMTRGQAFRLDLADGPLFLEESLWRFAGRPGNELEDETTEDRSWEQTPKAPIWPTTKPVQPRRAA